MELSEELNADFKESDIEKAVSEIKFKSEELSHRTWYELALSCIDLTTLNSTDTFEQGEKLATKVSLFSENYPDLPNVAAICVYPSLIESVRKSLVIPGVKLASVSGGFPSSQTFLDVKVLETMMAVANGADEIDIVLNLGSFFSQDYKSVLMEISTLKGACDQAHLKVILETGALKSYSNIWKGSMLAMQGGADFIKTSTGKLDPAATPEAAWVMCRAIKAHFEKTNIKIGFKAAGGIAETADALVYIAIVKEVLGDEWLTSSLFRIGASRLANNLLSALTGDREIYF